MVNLLFAVSTALALLGLVLCLWHARTREEYGFILAGIAWGYVLEQASIAGYDTYSYHLDSYILTLFDVPLDIAFSWAAILYAGWQTGKYLGLSPKRLPFFVGLFALHIDLAIDVVAIRVPFWSWNVPDAIWYGVPLHNFWGWWTVSFLFVGVFLAAKHWLHRTEFQAAVSFPSGLLAFVFTHLIVGRWIQTEELRLAVALVVGLLVLAGVFLAGRRWPHRSELHQLLIPPTALVLFVAGISAYSVVHGFGTIVELATLVVLVLVSFAVVLTGDVDPRRIPLPIVAVPFLIHGHFLVIGFWIGTFVEYPVLLVVALTMVAFSLILHAVPHWYQRRSNETAT